ncbi:MAG: Tmc redox complex protein TmcD, partial [Desulfobacteraceae bacterium]
VNGELWDGEYEKAWCLTPLPDSRFAVFGCNDEEWTVNVNNEEWNSRFEFVWNLQCNGDGRYLAAAFQNDSRYGVVVNDQPWENGYQNMTGMVLSDTGDSAAVVQVDPMKAADIEAFKEGLFSVARNGNRVLDRTFLNLWDIAFDKSGKNIACGARLNREEYTIACNDSLWDKRFQSVWRPVFLESGGVLAPVRHGGKWRLFQDNEPLWKNGYEQLWQLRLSPGGDDIAAVVSTTFGKWTVAVNDKTWDFSCDAMICDLHYSRNGSCLVAVAKDKKVWDLVVDGKAWHLCADKLFPPGISDDGSMVAAVVEKQGLFHLVVNNRAVASGYEYMTEPVFSPDNAKVLLKGIKKGVYQRRVLSL